MSALDQAAVPGSPPDLVDCPRCDGAGVVSWNPTWCRDPQEDREEPCPLCEEEGVLEATDPRVTGFAGDPEAEYECERPGRPHGCGSCDACLTEMDD